MVIAPTKMHPLWYTPISPLMFLMSAIAVGFPMVIFESILASRVSFKLKPETKMLSSIARYTPVLARCLSGGQDRRSDAIEKPGRMFSKVSSSRSCSYIEIGHRSRRADRSALDSASPQFGCGIVYGGVAGDFRRWPSTESTSS